MALLKIKDGQGNWQICPAKIISNNGGGSSSSTSLVTDGLVSWFDLRNATPTINSAAGSTIFNASQGTGSLYSWSASTMTSTDGNGSKLTRSLTYSNSNGSTSQTSCGTAFTWLIKSYATEYGGGYYVGDYSSQSNSNLFLFKPKYNTSSSTGQVAQEGIGNRVNAEDYVNVVITVNNDVLKLYINGTLSKTIDGSTITGFVSWYQILVVQSGNVSGTEITAVGVWNKALSAEEVTQMQGYT